MLGDQLARKFVIVSVDFTRVEFSVIHSGLLTLKDIAFAEVTEQYGLQLVAFENGGTTKTRLCKLGGDAVVDTKKYPLVMLSMKREGASVSGKLWYLASVKFEAKDLFTRTSTAWTNRPVLNEDVYYLMSDSPSVGFGSKPFEKGSNSIALEVLRTPRPL
jgi:hypothetical protein